MQTKYFLIVMALCLFVMPIYGQKLKDKRVTVHYVSLPINKLPDDYKTYSVEAAGSGFYAGSLNRNTYAEAVRMDGFKRLVGSGSDFGHLRVYLYVGTPALGEAKLKSKTTTTKKDDVETKKTVYWYSVPFKTNISCKVVDPEGAVLATYSKNTGNTLTTKQMSTSAAARRDYVNKIGTMGQSVAKSAAKEVVEAANDLLTLKYDFAVKKEYEQLYLIKKHKTEDDFEKSYETAKTVLEKASATTPAEEIKEKLADAIKFWKEQAEIDPKGDKKLMRIHEAANYNLAIVHYYLDELDEAKTYAYEVLQSVGKDRKSKNLIEKISKTSKTMALHNIHTLHHKRDLSNAAGPSKVAAFEQEKEELAEANNSIEGTITKNGEQIEGTVMQDKDAETLIFGEGGNVKFVVEGNNEMKEHDLTAAGVTSFTLGERSFTKLNFSPCAKGKTEPQLHIMEEVYVSDKITLYQYYPSNGALGGETTEFAYQKNGEEMPVSLLDTQFLIFDKGIAKYFADCTDLTSMCAAGDIKMNKDDLIKAARIYSELCE